MDEPGEENIKFAQQAFDEAAAAVTKEKALSDQKELQWKAADKKEQERKEKEEAKIHREKLDKLAAKVAAEKKKKQERKDRISEDKKLNELKEKKKWRDAFELIKAKRAEITANEEKQKKDFLDEIEKKEKEKKLAAPGELFEMMKKNKERSEKYASSHGSDQSSKYIARRMKMRACEAMVHAEMQLNVHNSKVGGNSADHSKEANQKSQKC